MCATATGDEIRTLLCSYLIRARARLDIIISPGRPASA